MPQAQISKKDAEERKAVIHAYENAKKAFHADGQSAQKAFDLVRAYDAFRTRIPRPVPPAKQEPPEVQSAEKLLGQKFARNAAGVILLRGLKTLDELRAWAETQKEPTAAERFKELKGLAIRKVKGIYSIESDAIYVTDNGEPGIKNKKGEIVKMSPFALVQMKRKESYTYSELSSAIHAYWDSHELSANQKLAEKDIEAMMKGTYKR